MARRNLRRRSFFIAALAAASIGAAGYHGQQVLTQLLPPSNKLGECYAQVFVPPVFKTEIQRELIKDATEQIEKVPAKYEFIEQTIMVKEPSERLEVVPATYEWIEERVLIQPETERIEIVPPVYETIQERVVETPAHSVWKKRLWAVSAHGSCDRRYRLFSRGSTHLQNVGKAGVKDAGHDAYGGSGLG